MKNQFSVSIIIPCYNSKIHLDDTLIHLYRAIEVASIQDYEIIVVDDGSTDGTYEYLASQRYAQLSVVRQNNTGRLVARLTGLKKAHYNQIVFLDSRVWVEPNSLLNLLIFIQTQSKRPKMIISKINFPPRASLLGLFWDAIARIVWFRFYQGNENVLLTKENFDKFPKGTTYLYVEKDTISDSYRLIPTEQLYSSDTNDDTLLIREISERAEVVILRSFQATYFPRTSLREFCAHTKHRGSVAEGGFFAPEARGRKILVKLLFLPIILTFMSIFLPLQTLLGIILILFVTIEIIALRLVSTRHFVSLNLYVLPFIIFYLIGFLTKKVRRDT